MRILPFIVLFSSTWALIQPSRMEGSVTNAHDSSPAEIFGPRLAPLLQEAQEKLRELDDRLKEAHDKGDAPTEAQVLDSIGLLNYVNQRFDEALEAFSRSLAIYRQLNSEKFEATELCEMGAVYTAQGMEQKALEVYKQALPLWRGFDRGREAATLGKMAEIFRSLHDPGEALHFDQAALEAFSKAGDRGGQATVLNNMGLAYFASGSERKAASYFEKARALYREVKNQAGEATALNNLAVACSASGNNTDALAALDQALELDRKVNDRNGEAMTLNSIGVVYSRMGQSLMAHRFYGLAASTYRALGDQQAETRETNALSLAITDAKRNGHKKKTDPDQGWNECPSRLPNVQ